MSPSNKFKNAPNPQLPLPRPIQLLLIGLMLTWLAAVPIIVGVIIFFWPDSWPAWIDHLTALTGLTALLGLPVGGFFIFVYSQKRASLRPLALTLLAVIGYGLLATLIRVVAGPSSSTEMLLRLTGLTMGALLIGGAGLRLAGVPGWMLSHAFGFDRPSLTALLTGLSLSGVVTIGWPLTGALGDSWAAQQILWQTLATSLPEVIFFWGAVLGIITFNFQQHKIFAAILTICIYVAFTSTMLLPHNDWSKLALLVTAVPFALLMIELRALTGSIWAGLLFAWIYRAAPLLFTDPRVELALITQPWQTAARLWMILGAGGLALILWLGRNYLITRRPLSALHPGLLALATFLLVGTAWLGLWSVLGRPGFHNDGFLIIMAEQSDLSEASAIADPLLRRQFVRDRLIETARNSQAPIRAALDEAGLSYRPFYLINMIQVDGHHRVMERFVDLPGVARVMFNPNVRPYPAEALQIGYRTVQSSAQEIDWNISQVRADRVWELGITGQGIVVGGQDTGYDWSHPALQRAYRGRTGEHTYSWVDAWSETSEPFDDGQHGTHTMGSILGDDGNGNRIGMAPGAEWIGCRNMRRGLGNPASYTACMEFFLAPYPAGGDPFSEGDVSKAPHVINNSWGCPDMEGCDDNVLEPALEALRAAGIMMVVSAGNSGPGCQSVADPPARYDSAFSVGATERGGQITFFSSRGPVPNTARLLLKPDITAPGANIRSSLPGGGYGAADGTSMAGPHVTGLVALLWSANPALVGQIEATEEIIRQTARPVDIEATCQVQALPAGNPSLLEQVETLQTPPVCACGNVTGSPNNVYGWGEIDALAAVERALTWEALTK